MLCSLFKVCIHITNSILLLLLLPPATYAPRHANGNPGAATLAASPVIFWAFMVKAQMGLDGAALAFISCQLCTLLGLLGCVAWRAVRMAGKREQTWGGWSKEALQDWPEYFK
jgi:hypothetical protein